MNGALEAGGVVFGVGLGVWEAAFVLLGWEGVGGLGFWEAAFVLLGWEGVGGLGFWVLVGVGGLVGVGVGGVEVDRLVGLMLAGLYL